MLNGREKGKSKSGIAWMEGRRTVISHIVYSFNTGKCKGRAKGGGYFVEEYGLCLAGFLCFVRVWVCFLEFYSFSYTS